MKIDALQPNEPPTQEYLVQTVSLLESKLVSLTNINCALQSQIDEMSLAYDMLRQDREEIKKEKDSMALELEGLKLNKEKKKKEKKQ